jgi:hypothetical protein
MGIKLLVRESINLNRTKALSLSPSKAETIEMLNNVTETVERTTYFYRFSLNLARKFEGIAVKYK